MKFLPVLAIICAATAGCTSVKTDTVYTGLFDNDPEKIVSNSEALQKKIVAKKVVTLQDLEAQGFNLKAPNVVSIPGPLAFKRIFGDTVFCDKDGVERLNIAEYSQYRGYAIPYRRIETTVDRVYISEGELFKRGEQMQVFMLFKQDQLCYCQILDIKIDTYYSHYALFEGLILAMKGPGKAALSIQEKLQTYLKPGLQFIAPIPIP